MVERIAIFYLEANAADSSAGAAGCTWLVWGPVEEIGRNTPKPPK